MISLTPDLSVPRMGQRLWTWRMWAQSSIWKRTKSYWDKQELISQISEPRPSPNTDQLLVSICGTVLSRSLKPYWLNPDFLWSIISVSRKWGVRGFRSHTCQTSLSILVLSVCDVFFIVPRGNVLFFFSLSLSLFFFKYINVSYLLKEEDRCRQWKPGGIYLTF